MESSVKVCGDRIAFLEPQLVAGCLLYLATDLRSD
jgi:hypothetical protein